MRTSARPENATVHRRDLGCCPLLENGPFRARCGFPLFTNWYTTVRTIYPLSPIRGRRFSPPRSLAAADESDEGLRLPPLMSDRYDDDKEG